MKDRPDHPFVLFNLGMTYADAEQYDEAVYWLERCLQISPPEQSHVRKAYALLVSTLFQQSKFDEAMNVCRGGRHFYPDDKELLYRQAMLNHQRGALDDAISDYRQVLEVQIERHFSSMDRGLTSYKARQNLAVVYEDQGQLELANGEWVTILNEFPDYHPAKIGFAECLLKQKEFDRAKALIGRIQSIPGCRTEGHRLAARSFEIRGDILQALRRLQQGINQAGNDPVLLREQARLFYSSGDLRSAKQILQYLTEVLPQDRSVRNNLNVVNHELRNSPG